LLSGFFVSIGLCESNHFEWQVQDSGLRVFFALSILAGFYRMLWSYLMPAFSSLAIDSLPLAFGIIMAIIGLVFYTQGLPGKFWRRFYAFGDDFMQYYRVLFCAALYLQPSTVWASLRTVLVRRFTVSQQPICCLQVYY